MPPKPTVHLVCNAHLDPVWLWEWEEGAAEALSTFRVAADFCESHAEFVFVHGEAVLYQWIEEYEPALFERIRRLVKEGKWAIGSGWYLQPDVNMPSGESIVRQIQVGRRYFADRFDVRNTVAYNFDSFGHSRGLVQILSKAGYIGYVHCRPLPASMKPKLPGRTYRWIGFDGSEVVGQHSLVWYMSLRGCAAQHTREALEHPERRPDLPTLVLWGIGNHGGGASREDLDDLGRLRAETTDERIEHSSPEAYFDELLSRSPDLPDVAHSVRHVFRGCYTSMALVKQRHRELENAYYSTEMLVTQAWAQGLLADYPASDLAEALRDLLFCEFHDILPGSSIPQVEASALRRMEHGLEILSRLRARAFFALAAEEPKARPGEVPVFFANPHPWAVEDVFSCEVNMPDQRWVKDLFCKPVVRVNGRPVPAQAEQEAGNLSLEWRKRVAFRAKLRPAAMNRVSISFEDTTVPPPPSPTRENGCLILSGEGLTVAINERTGLLDSVLVEGKEVVAKGAGRIVCIEDGYDPWSTPAPRLTRVRGRFRLMSRRDANILRGFPEERTPAVALIEDGPVRSIVEAVFGYGHSAAVVRYAVPKQGRDVDIEVRVRNAEKACMLKVELPLAFTVEQALTQTVYGRETVALDGSEQVGQQWVAALPAGGDDLAMGILNDGTYGFDATSRRLRLNLLRSPLYAHLPVMTKEVETRDRAQPFIDQGERSFRFRLVFDQAPTLLRRIERLAQNFNQPPTAIGYFPPGEDRARRRPCVGLSGETVVLTAMKKAEDSDRVVLRLFEPTGKAASVTLRWRGGPPRRLSFGPFEIKTLYLDPETGKAEEGSLIEGDLGPNTC